MNRIKIIITCFTLFAFVGISAQESRSIHGNVSDGNNPIQDVRIQVEGSQAQTFTDANGKYKLGVEVGDLLKYSYNGMKDYLVRVEDVTRFLNLIMIPDIEELPEVTVTGSNRKTQGDLAVEYPVNPRIIKTAFGYLNADTAPGKVILLSDEEITSVSLCLLNVIRNRFPGVSIIGDCQQGGDVIIRGAGSIANARTAVYDLDGLILQDAPIWLNVDQIKRIAVIPSIAFASRYGALGNGGVVIINTITGNPQSSKIVDQARLRNNYYKGDALGEDAVQNSQPAYIAALREAGSFDDARVVYNRYAAQYSGSPYFYLDAYRHFYEDLDAMEFADGIIRDNSFRFEDNAVVLKALAYNYQEQGRFKKALETFKEVFILRPQYSQSYQDLAGAYQDARAYDKAASMYARYKYLVDENFLMESEYFSKIIQHESDNFLKLHAGKAGIDLKKVLTDLYVENTTRMVVEWNDTEAEFELQFVNPEGQYHIWKHTYAGNEARIVDEKIKGYSMEEHIINKAMPGLWEVNIRYLGNKSLTPTYLKITTYYNYGQRNQQKDVKTFKLTLKDNWQKLLSINNPGVSRVR